MEFETGEVETRMWAGGPSCEDDKLFSAVTTM